MDIDFGSFRHFVVSLILPWHHIFWLDLFHAIKVATDYRAMADRGQGVGQALVAFWINANGGASVAALLTGQAAAWLFRTEAVVLYIVIHLLVHYIPVLFKLLRLAPIKLLVDSLDGLTLGRSIVKAGVDGAALLAFHVQVRDSPAAAILCGIVSGCAGGILSDTMTLHRLDWQFRTPAALANNSLSEPLRIALVTAPLYYIVTDPHHLIWSTPLLSSEDGLFTVMLSLLVYRFGTGLRRVLLRRRKPHQS